MYFENDFITLNIYDNQKVSGGNFYLRKPLYYAVVSYFDSV